MNSLNNVRDNEWHHIAFTSDGNEKRIYLDFNLLEAYIQSNTSDYGPNFVIGSWTGGLSGSAEFAGRVDDVKLFNQALDESELANAFYNIDNSADLLLYANFEEGAGNNDNSNISEVLNIASNINGTIQNFNLNNAESNYVCDLIFEIPENCTDECAADVVNLNTGIDFNDNSELPIGEYEGGWQLISSPDDGVSFPRPSYVLNPNSVWAQLPGTQYISPYPSAFNNQTFSDPYVFERCFCICEPTSEVNLDVAAYFDNFLTLGLYDSEGNLIEELINYTGSASTITFTGDPYTSNTSYSLNTGTYCIRAGLRNDGQSTMGLAIQASVSGAGLIENGCCTPFTIVTGTIYQDDDCNGSFVEGSEEPLSDIEVQLCDSDGTVVMTTTTDTFGYYSFFDVGVGSFTVKHTPSDNQSLSEGMGGYTIDVGSNSVSGDLDFGICPPENCTDECAADLVNLNTGIDFNDNSELPIGEYEGGWQLISSPDDGVSFPRPSYVLNPNSVWAQLPGTQYISPYPSAFNNQTFSDPYVFERCFCICEPTSEVNLDVAAYFDNFLTLGLYDSEGNLIEELINYTGSASTITFTGDPYTSNTSYSLNTGTYCIRAGLRNDGQSTMGLAIQASVSGAGLIENGCCTPFTIVTGTIYQDDDCNGSFVEGSEEPLSDIEVQLCASDGTVVMTTTTDTFGYYSFFDVGVGSFTVKHVPSGNQNLSQGVDGYPIEVTSNSVTGDLDFGVCGDPCLMDEVAPFITCTDETIQISLDQSGSINVTEIILSLISATDECDDDVSFDLSQFVFNCSDIGTNEITITATDDSDNSSTCEITVIIEDKLSPTISCSGVNVSLEINQDGLAVIGDSYLEHIDATDECGIESYSIDQDAFNCDQLGINTVIVSVIDVNGNSSQCTLMYNIVDPNGYCEECCGTSEELTLSVQENITVSTLIFNESMEFTLGNPNLLDCQYISKIIWGDGTINNLNENDPLPSHMYDVTSVYLVTVEVSSIDGAGNLCQTDEVSLPIVYNDCPVSTTFEEIEEYRLKIYPIPAKNLITIDLSKNPSGYSLNLYNNLGQLIDQTEIESNILTLDYDVSNLPKGIYNIVFEENGSTLRLESRVLKV
jgi:hypothetical protein